MSEDDNYELTDEGVGLLYKWATLLLEKGYDIEVGPQLWEAAGFLVAQGAGDDLNVEEVAVMLCFLVDSWDHFKDIIAREGDDDEGS